MHIKTINVAIADADCLLSVLLKNYFKTHPDFSFCGHMSTYEDLLAFNKWDSTVVLLSLKTLGLNGINKLKLLLENHPSAKILCYSPFSDLSLEMRLVNIGIKGHFTIDESIGSIISKINIANMDGIGMNITKTRKAGYELFYPNRMKDDLFNSKEKMIIQLLTQGKTNREIANQLGLTFRSVQSYVARIKKKANCKYEKQLILLSLEKGWDN